VRVRYVRYADDFLLGIAGPKELVVKIRNRIQTFVKSDLKLNLMGGEITHIGAGKVKFLGMWISAVPHSKFTRRFGKMLEKKKRVKNRILLQKKIKEERLLKIVKRTFKKALKGNLKLIKNSPELRERTEVLKSCILQDPKFSKEWISTYQQFLRALSCSKFFVPDNLKKSLDELDIKISEWEVELSTNSGDPKKRYKKLVGRYDTLPPQIEAPLIDIREKLKDKGLISKSNKPKAVGRLIHVPDDSIVKWYNQVGGGLLHYYSCCRNFYKVKNYVDYMVRWSAIHTLACKHKSSVCKIIAKHTKDLIVKDLRGLVTARFVSSKEIRTMGRQFRINVSRDVTNKVL
jgi:Type II intron maturase